MKKLTLVLSNALLATSALAGFSFGAGQYADGEALSAHGASGGSWTFAEGSEMPTGDAMGSDPMVRLCNVWTAFEIAGIAPFDGCDFGRKTA